jgi:surface protein
VCKLEVSNIDFLSGIDFSSTTNMQNMFQGCVNITTIPPLLNTSAVTNMSNMFFNCSNITTIPLLDTSAVTNMSGMFYDCSSLITISQFNTSNATNMGSMFTSCYKLQTIDITKLVSSAYECFYACRSLTKLIIRTMNTIPTFGSNMFSSCYHFDGTVNSTYNPDGLKDGRIYVPDAQVDNLKAATGWSNYAEIIVPLSTLQE